MLSRTINLAQNRLFFLLLITLFVVVACGRREAASRDGAGTSESPSSNRLAAPTMPAGQFTAVGEQSILTDTARLTQTTQMTQSAQAVSAAAPDLARGEAAYVKNKCGDCHGAAGEGVADKGSAITEMSMTLAEFDKLLRTGNGLGNTHIFGRSAVSPSGMESLYAYTQSLE